MLHRIILYFSIRISLLIFHKRQPLSYSLFNFYFEKDVKKLFFCQMLLRNLIKMVIVNYLLIYHMKLKK